MSIKLEHAYVFAGGALVGRFVGLIPSVLIFGLLLYVADSNIFTSDNLNSAKNTMLNLIRKK